MVFLGLFQSIQLDFRENQTWLLFFAYQIKSFALVYNYWEIANHKGFRLFGDRRMTEDDKEGGNKIFGFIFVKESYLTAIGLRVWLLLQEYLVLLDLRALRATW